MRANGRRREREREREREKGKKEGRAACQSLCKVDKVLMMDRLLLEHCSCGCQGLWEWKVKCDYRSKGRRCVHVLYVCMHQGM